MMSTLVIGGLMFAGLAFLARKGRASENMVEYQDKVNKIDQEIQQVRNKYMGGFLG